MKLYTRTDLERAARLAARAALRGLAEEPAVGDAVARVANDAPEYYDEHTVRELIETAAKRGLAAARGALEARRG
jgi:hypothetical protein